MGKYQVHQSDRNEKDRIDYLRAHGAQVVKMHRPVDLLICFQGVTAIGEVKTTRGKLNASQRAFLEAWDGIWAILRTDADCDLLLTRMLTPDLDWFARHGKRGA